VYTSNLPFTPVSHYDSRTLSPIEKGQPFNIVLNKLYLHDNGEAFWRGSAEITVVMTVDDGQGKEPRHLVVFHGDGIRPKAFLPLSDVLVYSTKEYSGDPLRIEIAVYEHDDGLSPAFFAMLKAAALAANAAPGGGFASKASEEAGKLVANTHHDEMILKFSMYLYPWRKSVESAGRHLGVARLSTGSYLVANARSLDEFGDRHEIHVDWDFQAYRVRSSTYGWAKGLLRRDADGVKAELAERAQKGWPIPPLTEWPRTPLDSTYAVFTIDDTPLAGAEAAIGRLGEKKTDAVAPPPAPAAPAAPAAADGVKKDAPAEARKLIPDDLMKNLPFGKKRKPQ
jgi:hypothetical protein